VGGRARRPLWPLLLRLRSVAGGLVLIAIVTLAGWLTGPNVVIAPLLVVGPLVAAVRGAPRSVAVVGAIAVALSVVLTFRNDAWDEVNGPAAVVSVTGGALLAIVVARGQRLLAGSVREHDAALAAEREARRRGDLLARLRGLLEAGPQPDIVLERLATLPVPDLADLVVIDVLRDDGLLDGAVTAAANPDVAARLREVRRHHPLDPAGHHPVAVALREREAQILPEMAEAELGRFAASREHLELIRDARYRSAIVLPLLARGRMFGVFTLIRVVGSPPFTEVDLQLGIDLAARAALALDNARLYRELAVSEQRLETIVGNLGEAVAAVAPDGRPVFVNEATAALLGAPSSAAIMAGELGDLPTIMSAYTILDEHGRTVPITNQPLSEALRGGDPEPRLLRAIERAGRRRDRWILARAAPIRDGAGQLQLVVSVIEDVTAVKRQEMRERLLSSATKLMTSSLDVETTLDKSAWAVVPELADWAWVDLVDDRGALRPAAVAHRDVGKLELLREWRRDYPPWHSDDRGPAQVLSTGMPVVWERVGPLDIDRYAYSPRHAELMRLIDTQSLIIVPMIAGGRTIGTMELATTAESHRLLGAGELELAEELAQRAAVAVVNAQVHAERTHIATTLQRSLLPPRLPMLPGLEIASRFHAAGSSTTEVGGDFYDLFAGREGWLVVVGDVTGKGPEAAAITSLARNTLRTAALYESDHRAMLQRLNETLAADPERRKICTAVLVGISGPHDEGVRLLVSRAGHPPPLRITTEGEVEEIGATGSLLGAFAGGHWTPTTMMLRRSERLVLYTDGVTDIRGGEGRFGADRLAAVLRELGPGAPPDAIARRIDEALRAFGEQRDDVALLVLGA